MKTKTVASSIVAAIVSCACLFMFVPTATAAEGVTVTSTKSFPSYTQVRKDLTTEATATSVEDNADWGGIENLDVPQTESQAEKDASGSVSAGAGASIDRAYSLIGQSMDCTALVSQALAARGINFHGWPEEYVNVPGGHVVTDGSLQPGDILIYANTGGWNGGAHYDHVALYVGNGQAVHGGWNGYSVALASAMTEKLTIVVRIP